MGRFIDPVDPQASVREIETRQRTRRRGRDASRRQPATCESTIRPWIDLGRGNDTGCRGRAYRAPLSRLGQVNDTHHDKTAISFWLTVQFAFHRVISKGIADRYQTGDCVSGSRLLVGAALVERIEEYSGFPARGLASIFIAVHRQASAKDNIERGQIYFGSRSMKRCPRHRRVRRQVLGLRLGYPAGETLYGAVDVSSKRKRYPRGEQAKAAGRTRRAFTGSSSPWKVAAKHETGDAPDRQARRPRISGYLREEQRREMDAAQVECRRDLHHGLLIVEQRSSGAALEKRSAALIAGRLLSNALGQLWRARPWPGTAAP